MDGVAENTRKNNSGSVNNRFFFSKPTPPVAVSVGSLRNCDVDHTMLTECGVDVVLFYKRMNPYLRGSLLVFVLGMVLGAVFAIPLQAALNPLIGDLKTLASGMKNDSFAAMMLTLFWHNLRTSVAMMIGGILFGVLPIIFVLANGALVGYILVITYQTTHLNPFLLFAAGILPHGIFEIPAYLLASAFGMRVGLLIFRSLGHRQGEGSWRRLGKDLLPTLVIVTILLFIAANIETGITPVLLGLAYRHG